MHVEKQTLGATIAALRKGMGMTQLELAEKMGVTDKAVSKWERDLSVPDVHSIPKLAQILGVSVEELMQVKKPQKSHRSQLESIADTALKGVGAAMGIAVTVLSILGKLEPDAAMRMLGIGLACISISLLKDHQNEK